MVFQKGFVIGLCLFLNGVMAHAALDFHKQCYNKYSNRLYSIMVDDTGRDVRDGYYLGLVYDAPRTGQLEATYSLKLRDDGHYVDADTNGNLFDIHFDGKGWVGSVVLATGTKVFDSVLDCKDPR